MSLVEYEKEGRIAIFTLNNPEAMNCISIDMDTQLEAALKDFRDDPDLWLGIITGAGKKAFCAGADIKNLLPLWRDHRYERWFLPDTPMHDFELWKPMIAAINGHCLAGGFEVALSCDIRIASENATFGLTEVSIGVIPGGGACARLPRLIPWKAAEIILMGQRFDAQEAYRIGFVSKVVPQDKLMETAREWANIICRNGPIAVRSAKEAMIRGANMPLREAMRLEFSMFGRCLGTDDFLEGQRAFVEKRRPNFQGR